MNHPVCIRFLAVGVLLVLGACGEVHSDAPDFDASLPPATLTVMTSGTGSVASAPVGIDCGAGCTQEFPGGTTVTLTAKPGAGFALAAWGGACAGTDGAVCTLVLDGTKSVIATFAPAFDINVKVNGLGTVTSTPAGINCGLDCTEPFAQGTQVTLTASAGADARFTGWGGACTGSAPCVITINEAKQVTASFESKLRLTVKVAGGGVVSSIPEGFTCSGDCEGKFFPGTEVLLTPGLVGGRAFMGWGGACTGAGDCKVKLAADTEVTARFGFKLTATVTSTCQTQGVTVSSTPAGLTCGVGNPCTVVFQAGTEVRMRANEVGVCKLERITGCSRFDGSDCMVQMDGDRQVTAQFYPDT